MLTTGESKLSSAPLISKHFPSLASEIPSLSESTFKGSVPFVFSTPFVNPSPSQSAAFHAELVATVWLAEINLQRSNGSVISVFSFPSFTPSPSESSFNGLVLSVISTALVTPSLSQSAVFQAVLVATVWFANTNLHKSFSSVPSAFSVASKTPSPSLSKSNLLGIPSLSVSISIHELESNNPDIPSEKLQ